MFLNFFVFVRIDVVIDVPEEKMMTILIAVVEAALLILIILMIAAIAELVVEEGVAGTMIIVMMIEAAPHLLIEIIATVDVVAVAGTDPAHLLKTVTEGTGVAFQDHAPDPALGPLIVREEIKSLDAPLVSLVPIMIQ